ncbi:MAG: hypothetical protein EU535_03220 [Promethearchaeota archaeon]|nr:MAG: hypothetical protein EU535_03220 [Candidatus Lokiarchaeota archaeon]
MIINLKQNTHIQLRQNLDSKKEKILIYECQNCSQLKTDFFKNRNCIFCFLKNLYINRNKKLSSLSINKLENLIENNIILLFFDYFKQIRKINKIFVHIEDFKANKCKLKDFECKIFPNHFISLRSDKKLFYDPILLYDFIQNNLKFINENEKRCIIDVNCHKCVIFIKDSFERILNLINHLKIIREFNEFKSINKDIRETASFYKYILDRNAIWAKETSRFKTADSGDNLELLEIYYIGKYELFQVSIFEILDQSEKKYEVNLSLNSESERLYFNMIVDDILKNLTIAKLDHIITIENLIKLYKMESLKLINSKFNFFELQKNKIAYYTSLKKLNLDRIFPLLIDDYIEEIFLDSPEDSIYINHQKYGRCQTSITYNSRELERIKTFLRLYSGQRLDFLNPSIKHVIKNKYFYCRFAIDVAPINFNNFSLDIRKLNKNILTIQDLLKNHTLDPLMAAFLYFCILRRINITATGETDTGKTTLINALDLLTPKEFRKIYVENVVESLNQALFEKHQLKYKVDSLSESLEIKYSKSKQIKTLLHRTPDLIYLGEILTQEEAEAMFHCLAAGLRGFQTIHSNDIDSLINRFLYHFKIDLSCLNDLDLLLLMKKDFNKRRIISINEINLNKANNEKFYRSIFNYNPESLTWKNPISLYETNTIGKLKKYEDLGIEKFNKIINIYHDIFKVLSEMDKINVGELTSFFHKVSYYSMTSIDLLVDFWENWKKKSSLNF